ncbi:MAG: hypothetical protein ABI652_04060 [Acidobacteriota bacterium]
MNPESKVSAAARAAVFVLARLLYIPILVIAVACTVVWRLTFGRRGR